MRTIAAIISSIFLFALTSCEKGDVEIKRLTKGDGIWTIESISYDTFDASGSAVVGNYNWNDVGEFVFFSSATANALYAHHLVVVTINDGSGGSSSYPGDVYYDGDRMFFQEDPDPNHSFPDYLEGTWTVTDDGRNKKVLTFYEMNGNALFVKRTMTIKH